MESIEVGVLLTDLVDSAAHLASMGDLEFAGLMAELENDIRHLIRKFKGREIDKTDGFLVVFPSPVAGLKFALELNRHMLRISRTMHRKLRVRTGLHFGKVVVRSNAQEHVNFGAKTMDIDGLAKVIAARVTSLAEPGQLLVTRTIFNLVREDENSAANLPEDIHWLAHGPYLLHGLNEPVEIHEVGEPEIAPLRPPVSKLKARRAILPQDEFILGWRPAVGHLIPSAPKWKLLRKLGEGGYGEVWLAQQHTRQLRVFKFCFNPARIRSLQREKVLLNIIRDNLGSRNDIVRIIDWNINDAPYFIALKYIPLDNLSAWMKQRPPSRRLSRETSMYIVHKAAEAIAAAHSVGILHKDVKPSNLLLGNNPVKPDIYLIDFGIGLYTPMELEEDNRKLNGTSSTHGTLRTSSISGSQMYLAPEVIEGARPNIQADIYALGVILYQLLCNDLSTGLHVGWQKKIEDPFLQEIIEQATNGNLRERFPTMNRFIEALDNLDQRRDEAARKFEGDLQLLNQRKALERANRRKAIAMVAVGVALPLAVVAGLFAYREKNANKLADTKIGEATEARYQANQLIGFFLKDMNAHYKDFGSMPMFDEMNSQLITYYGNQPEEFKDSTTYLNQAQACKNLADIYLSTRQYDLAERYYDSCGELVQLQMKNSMSSPDWRKLQAAVYQQKALFHSRRSMTGLTKESLKQALDVRRAIYTSSHDNLDNVLDLVNVCIDYGLTFPEGELDRSQLYYEALKVSTEAADNYPNSLTAQLAYSRSLMASSELSSVTPMQKIGNYREAISRMKRFHQRSPSNIPATEMLAKVYLKLIRQLENDPPIALTDLSSGQDATRALMDLDPDNPDWQQLRNNMLYSAANVELSNGNLERAVTISQEVLDWTKILLDQVPNQATFQKDYWDACKLRIHGASLLDANNGRKSLLAELRSNFRDLALRDLNRFGLYYYDIAVQEALFSRSPITLAEALNETTSTGKDNPIHRIYRSCASKLTEHPQAFDTASIRWSNEPISRINDSGFLTIENQEPDIFIVRVYQPGSALPYDEQMVCASPKGRVPIPGNSVPAISANTGVSVNGSPIIPVYQCAEFDTDRGSFTLKLSSWKRTFGKLQNFSIPDVYNIQPSAVGKFEL